jgi:type VI secretion system secreted protein VgrG
MQQEGIYFFFKHQNRKHELVLADSVTAHAAVDDYEKVPYYPRQQNERRERDHLDQWTMRRAIRPAVYRARDFNFMHPAKPVFGENSAPLDHAFNQYEIYDYPGEFPVADPVTVTGSDKEKADEEKAEADTQARIRLEEAQASFELVHGEGNARGLQCGALFHLEKYPRTDQNKEYLIVEAGYTIQVANYDSIDDPEAEPEVRVRLVAQDSKTPFRAPRTAEVPTIAGPQTATVVGPAEQEIWTDEYGRVLLQFHWDREGKSNENSSCWVRVSQAWAGQKWGSLHTPRIGQEVVVSFLEGNPNRPIVTGRVYNADNKPPYDPSKFPTQSGIKSHSSKDGTSDNFNEIRFEDKKGEEELHIQAEKNMTTLVKHDQSTTVQANRSAGVTGSDSVSVGGDRSVSVTGKHTVSVKKSDTETYSDKREVKVTGPDTLTITNAHTGNYNNARTNIITNLDTTTANGGKKTDVTGNFDTTASVKYEVTQGANKFTLTGPGATLTNGQSTIKLDGGKVTIEAAEQIEIKVGGNGIIISSGGTIDVIAATTATVSGGSTGTVTLSASTTDVFGAAVNVNGQGVVSVSGSMVKLG